MSAAEQPEAPINTHFRR